MLESCGKLRPRFEIERNGEIAYLEDTLAGDVLKLTHTEIPEKLSHMGLATQLLEQSGLGGCIIGIVKIAQPDAN
jgi:predicted GNAT family acetyltransferase